MGGGNQADRLRNALEAGNLAVLARLLVPVRVPTPEASLPITRICTVTSAAGAGNDIRLAGYSRPGLVWRTSRCWRTTTT